MKKLLLSMFCLLMAGRVGVAAQEKAEVGGKLVDIEVMDAEGTFGYLSNYVGGGEQGEGNKYLLVYFWTCPACNKGLPEVAKYVEKHKDRLAAVSINVSNDPNNWASMYQISNPFPWPNLSDGRPMSDGVTVGICSIPRFPTLVLADREGKIVDMWSASGMDVANGFAERMDKWFGTKK